MPTARDTRHLYVCKASAGTGKTYNLAAHFIALLMNRVPFRNILAVTFTNKATTEMKERILTYLNGIAQDITLADVRAFLNHVREVSLIRGLRTYSDSEYQQRAEELVRAILSEYDELRITTIDTFLQSLLTGLAQSLGQSAGSEVELDLKHVIATATDEVLTEDVESDAEIRKTVIRCLNERLSNEQKWDIRGGLIKMVQETYQESVQSIRDQILLPSHDRPECAKIIEAYRRQIDYRHGKDFVRMKELYERTRNYKRDEVIAKGSNYYSFIDRMGRSLQGRGGKADMFRGLTENLRTNLPNKAQGEVYDNLCEMDALSDRLRREYVRQSVFATYLTELLLVGYVLDRIRHDRHEDNTMLLAETANTLAKALRENGAEFLLMKAGIRYRHIMLDEFQDTSTLQWANFRMLIEEVLSHEDGSTLIVGDIKQSIYRWRNGDYRIMQRLDDETTNPLLSEQYRELRLRRNFRSRRNVVAFNLSTLSILREEMALHQPEDAAIYDEGYTPEQLSDYYVGSKDGGYVRLQRYVANGKTSEANREACDSMLRDMFGHIETLLAAGYRKRDMLILCRRSSESATILKTFRLLLDEVDESGELRFPHLHEAGKIISNDSFLLDSSIAVNLLISGLKYIVRGDEVAGYYIRLNAPDVHLEALDTLDRSLPMVDLVEQVSRIVICPNGLYEGDEVGFINCLRDKIRTFVGKYGSDVEAFLAYWDDQMHSQAIPAVESDDITIMTIHTSKGLQAKNVFLPFCNWAVLEDGKHAAMLWCPDRKGSGEEGEGVGERLIPVDHTTSLKDVGLEQEYQDEADKQNVDAHNLLYVACTRAEDNLYIYPLSTQYTRNSIGDLLASKLLPSDENVREWGEMQRPVAKAGGGPSMPEPFSFDHATILPATCQAMQADIRFRQSMQSRQMMMTRSEEDIEVQENIAFGTLCHAILERILTAADAEQVVREFYLSGRIPSDESRRKILALVRRLLSHPVAGEWFEGTWQVMREDAVLCPIRTEECSDIYERRMDRVMTRGEEAIVLDYKFGARKREHILQVAEYMAIMRRMGYKHVRGYLWYGFSAELVEVNE